METYRIDGSMVTASDHAFASHLARAHSNKSRPSCLCVAGAGIPMYVCRHNTGYLIKRMPNTGVHHHPDCTSYEPPVELSGLGEIAGALKEDIDDGTTALKLGFRLAKVGAKPLPLASGVELDSVRTDGSRLTLRGTLHYLWEEAKLNRWSPAMEGKRSWYVVRKYLLQAAADKTAKGAPLMDLLFIPETFSLEHKSEIESRRRAKLGHAKVAKGAQPLMLLLGEVKAIDTARYGYKMTIKHLPDMAFLVADDLMKRLVKRFESELGLWSEKESTRLLVIATFEVRDSGICSIEEACLVPVTDNWIPFESGVEADLMQELTQAGRRFTKSLRYNLATDRPLASAVLSDTAPVPTALYLVPSSANDAYGDALDRLIESSALTSWLWKTGEQAMPGLPPPAEKVASLAPPSATQ